MGIWQRHRGEDGGRGHVSPNTKPLNLAAWKHPFYISKPRAISRQQNTLLCSIKANYGTALGQKRRPTHVVGLEASVESMIAGEYTKKAKRRKKHHFLHREPVM